MYTLVKTEIYVRTGLGLTMAFPTNVTTRRDTTRFKDYHNQPIGPRDYGVRSDCSHCHHSQTTNYHYCCVTMLYTFHRKIIEIKGIR